MRQGSLQRVRRIPRRTHPHIALLVRRQDHRPGFRMDRLDVRVRRPHLVYGFLTTAAPDLARAHIRRSYLQGTGTGFPASASLASAGTTYCGCWSPARRQTSVVAASPIASSSARARAANAAAYERGAPGHQNPCNLRPTSTERPRNTPVVTPVVSVALRWISGGFVGICSFGFSSPKMQKSPAFAGLFLVGARGFEPPTPSLPD